ncbi:glycosyltransferase [Vibrio crassostreae]|uniref:glycosyltransferase n=1 Tax=Vibrio crassostreae TaxID=246167 RepID=UPI001045B243|nr:glycosyltransferase [Vibrio crassostreae]TCT71103.1 glycosyltransferase involved in cell wall biosynthesis [Vibrio crassostreae]CAK2197702.1 putative Glycosyltransferase family 1 protein [Vibrio crassostreae]CAK2402416.1 putative Glycosyltransferase family 1 protein [Vibrio crassostreae]CAK2906907.1 putative Glycosyltransferase family 1 protein [Vibrio crassostreae]
MKNVLIVAGGMNTGGAEKWISDVIKLSYSKVNYHIVVHSELEQHYEDMLTSLGVKFHRICNRGILSYVRKLILLINDIDADVVHSHVNHFSSVVLLSKAFCRSKYIVHCHNDLSVYKKNASKFKLLYYKSSELIINLLSDVRIAVSDKACRSFFTESTRNQLMYCGVNPDEIKNELETKDFNNDELSKFLDSSIFNKNVFHIGRFVYQKNHDFIIELAKLIAVRDPSIAFILIGDGPKKKEFLNRCNIENIKNVFVFSGVNNVPSLIFSRASSLILPSHHEGLPITLMESQCVGVKSFVSDRITSQCDLDYGLIEYLPIEDSYINTWVEKIVDYSKPNKFNEEFVGSKFDLCKSIDQLIEMYEN